MGEFWTHFFVCVLALTCPPLAFVMLFILDKCK